MSILGGFEVYFIENGRRSFDDYARTDAGELLKKDAHGNWSAVPKRGELLIKQEGLDYWEVW